MRPIWEFHFIQNSREMYKLLVVSAIKLYFQRGCFTTGGTREDEEVFVCVWGGEDFVVIKVQYALDRQN